MGGKNSFVACDLERMKKAPLSGTAATSIWSLLFVESRTRKLYNVESPLIGTTHDRY